MTIAALVSGGVDSTVAVHLLKEQGCTPDLFYIQIGSEDKEGFMDCPAEEDIELTQFTARKYGCRFEIVDLHREYWDNVVAYTIDTVRRGLTPNTDVMCNKLIKFGAFVERRGKDYDRIATGHYATMTDIGGVRYLSTAVDPVKDQTDFLSQLSYDQLRPLMFPIGGLMKEQVREIARNAKLPSAGRKDSQGICFLGKINYNDFLRRYLGEHEGKIIELETGKQLGTHRGYWFHTIGQRKGLLLGGGPWFVVKKDIDENILYVSRGYDTEAQYGKEVDLLGFHFLSPAAPSAADSSAVDGSSAAADLQSAAINIRICNPQKESGEIPVKFKIRHTPTFTDGLLTYNGDKAHISSRDKLQGIAAGQYATIYDSDARLVLATGMIT